MPSAKRKIKRTPKQSKQDSSEINLSIKPGTTTVLTIETGEEKAGEIPVRIHLEQSQGRGKIVSTRKRRIGSAGGFFRWGRISAMRFLSSRNMILPPGCFGVRWRCIFLPA